MAGKSKFLNQFTVGCDPEMVIRATDGRIINVSDRIGKTGTVGYDHGGRVVEFRPAPAKGTYTLVKNIHKLMADSKLDALRNHKWQAGAVIRNGEGAATATLGGHVWLDLNPNNQLHNARIKALDIITEYLERLDILPRQDCVSRRHGQYGKFGDVRFDDAATRFEYRTMPSWLFDPKVAFACLTLAKLAAYNPAAVSMGLKPSEASWKELVAMISQFKGDKNTDRLLENVMSKGIKNVQAPSDADVQKAWEGKLGF